MEANAAAPGAKPKTYTIKLACGIKYEMMNNTKELYAAMDTGAGQVDGCMSSHAGLGGSPRTFGGPLHARGEGTS